MREVNAVDVFEMSDAELDETIDGLADRCLAMDIAMRAKREWSAERRLKVALVMAAADQVEMSRHAVRCFLEGLPLPAGLTK